MANHADKGVYLDRALRLASTEVSLRSVIFFCSFNSNHLHDNFVKGSMTLVLQFPKRLLFSPTLQSQMTMTYYDCEGDGQENSQKTRETRI